MIGHPDRVALHDEIHARPAVQRGIQVLADQRKPQDATAKENLFGATQYQRR